MIRVFVADDHQVVREGLRLMLEAEEEFSVVGEAGDGFEVLKLVSQLRPEVVVLDLMMPGLIGTEVARRISHDLPDTRVVILSMHDNEGYIYDAMQAGAMAYVLKRSSSAQLIQAIREAIAGKRYFSPPLSQEALDAYVARSRGTLDPLLTLTPREREVLHMAANGSTTVEIASQLVISPRTAEMHRRNLMRKLNLRNQTDLVRFAIQRRLLPPD